MLNSFITTNRVTIPRTCQRYSIDQNYRLYDDHLGITLLDTIDSLDRLVNLPGTIYGENFTLFELAALTFKPLYLPIIDIYKAELTRRTDIIENSRTMNNYFWKFKEPIISMVYPGFRYIPGFTRYLIDIKGNVLSLSTGKYLTQHISSVGYPSVRILNDINTSAIMSVHVLVALSFCQYGSDVCGLVVDHLNGDKTDNTPENLEWVKIEENNRRAQLHGLRHKKFRRVLCTDIKTDVTTSHESPAALALYLNVGKSSIFQYLNRINHDCAFKQQFLIRYEDVENTLITIEDIVRYGSQPRKVLVKNIHTGQITEYGSTAAFLKTSGLTRKQLYGNLKRKNQKLYGDIIFKYSDDSTEWVQ